MAILQCIIHPLYSQLSYALYILHATGTQGKGNNALVSMNCFIYLNMLKEQRNYEIVLLLQINTNFKNKSKFMLAYSHVKAEFIQSLGSCQ